MGKVLKLHHRLVKKRNEIKVHKKAISSLLGIISMYADRNNWKATGNTRDILRNGVVIGMEEIMEWRGPGTGPEVAKKILQGVVENDKSKTL